MFFCVLPVGGISPKIDRRELGTEHSLGQHKISLEKATGHQGNAQQGKDICAFTPRLNTQDRRSLIATSYQYLQYKCGVFHHSISAICHSFLSLLPLRSQHTVVPFGLEIRDQRRRTRRYSSTEACDCVRCFFFKTVTACVRQRAAPF